MPTLFDSNDEFNEWFSKDIENFAEKQSGLDEGKWPGVHWALGDSREKDPVFHGAWLDCRDSELGDSPLVLSWTSLFI